MQNEITAVDPGGACCQDKEYIPPRTELLRNNEVSFRFLSVGCVVRVGCKEIPFADVDVALSEFNDYVKHPHTTIKKWNEIFKKNE